MRSSVPYTLPNIYWVTGMAEIFSIAVTKNTPVAASMSNGGNAVPEANQARPS